MDLKNAVAVCLISLFSATLVVMIVRALDLQTAAQIEPQLASIVEELRAIRQQGGIAAAPASAATSEAVEDGLIVYYFHGNTRCPTCQAIESQSYATVQSEFAPLLTGGQLVWKILNYEQPAGSPLGKKFEVQVPVVVLAKMKGGRVQDWKRLDEVWAIVDDKPAFAKYIRGEISRMLGTEKEAARPGSSSAESKSAPPAPAPADLPVPAASIDLPVPK